ncbi:MAG: MFS transporter [Pyrobaculum sp.]
MERWGKTHWGLFAVVSASFFLDGVLFSLVPVTIYLIQPHLASYVFAANSLAFMAGAFAFGKVTDVVGRRLGLILSLLTYTVGSILFVSFYWGGLLTFGTLVLLTSVINFGVGGEVGPSYAAMAELSPPRLRGRALMLATNFWNIGAAIIAGLSLWYKSLAEEPDVAVFYTFLTAIALATVVFMARLHLPESPRWLVTAGRRAEAETLLRKMGMSEMPIEGAVGLKEALRRHLFRLAVLLMVTSTQLATYNIAAYYSPYAEGFPLGVETAPVIVAVANLGASIGAFLLIPAIDKSRRFALLSSYVGGLATALLLATMPGGLSLYLSILFSNLVFSEWAWASLSVLESELFPTGVRASVVGLVTATAWLINTSLVLAEAFLTAGQFLAINAVLWLLGLTAALAWASRGVESARRRLEELY